jgi:surface protein
VEQIPGLPGDIAAPAAAYSVRKVRTAYTGSALRVRRDSDDLSFDVGFDASGNLDTGSLLTKMTASLNTLALPGDYSGLAAAYSLRRVSSSYSGYAIEVRKASTNASASIGFYPTGDLNTASLLAFIQTGSETPIDTYSGLAAAYSLRRVVPAYAGDAIEIQSGSVSQSIGFNSFGDLDVAAIRTFAGSGDAFVKTWYDQSGNNNHASASSTSQQPKLVSAGTVLTVEGKPAMLFDGINDQLDMAGLHGQSLLDQYFVVSTSDTQYLYPNVGTGQPYGIVAQVGQSLPNPASTYGSVLLYVNGSLLTNPTWASTFTAQNGYKIVLHQSASTSTWSQYSFGNLGSYQYTGYLQELIAYTSSQASNRTYIENNINSYYGIYTPTSVSTENAFVKTWYDQSGNNNHATQSVDAKQPLIILSGSIVTSSLGTPALSYRNSTAALSSTIAGLTGFTNMTVFAVNQPFTASAPNTTNQRIFGIGLGGGDLFVSPGLSAGAESTLISGETYGFYFTGNQGRLGSTTYSHNARQTLLHSIYTLNSGFLAYKNGERININLNNQITTGSNVSPSNISTPSNTFHIGTINGDLSDDQLYQELLVYSIPQTASRTLIEDNINGYYNIFTQSLSSGSGYVTTWYDQSGNNRHATQSVAISQPLILSSGSIVNNGNPGLLWANGKYLDNATPFTASSIVWVAQSTNVSSFQTILNTRTAGGAAPGVFGGQSIRTQAGATSYRHIGYLADGSDLIFPNGQMFYNLDTVSTSNSVLNRHSGFLNVDSTKTITNGIQIGIHYDASRTWVGYINELIVYPSNQSTNRAPIQQDVNRYFNIYTQPTYNQNSNSLSLFSSPTVVAGAANASPTGLTTGGPEGLITVSRTGSGNYTLWKNRVPTKTSLPPSVPQSQSIYLNAANVSNAIFSGSQNTVAYASVGAGLTDDEVYTYYELVDNLQTNLGRSKSTNPNAFITTWDTRISGTGTVTGTSSIALPLFGTQAITASWGDGTVSLISQSAQNDRIHTYATPGVYTVSITGQGQGFQFNNGGDRNKLMDIAQWGSISGSTTNAFYGCTNLVGTAGDSHVLQTTSSIGYFRGASKFNGYLNNWNTSDITDAGTMFNGAASFNQNIGAWDVSKITNFTSMFNSATSFNNNGSSDIDNWRFSTTTNINMSSMFGQSEFSPCRFNQYIGSWNTERVTNMSSMFIFNPLFNQNINTKVINAGLPNEYIAWNTSNVTDISRMFESATLFNQPIGDWNTSNVTNISRMFERANRFNQNINTKVINAGLPNEYIAWNTSNVTDMSRIFYATATVNSFNQPIGNWNTSKVTNMERMFDGGGNRTAFNQDISTKTVNIGSLTYTAWDVSNVLKMNQMFRLSSFNQPLDTWNVSKVTDMSEMFRESVFNQDIGSWNVSSCVNFSNFMAEKTTYSYLHTIYDGWINYKLQPSRTINFNTINYSGSAAEGRALLTRPYNTGSITAYSSDGPNLALTCSFNHNVVAGNKIFISGSSELAINGVQTVQSTSSATMLTLALPTPPPSVTGDILFTGYGWSITDGGVV